MFLESNENVEAAKSWDYQALPDLTDEQFARWQQVIEQRTGIYLARHKSILQVGLTRRMREIECADYEAYFQRLTSANDQVEWAALLNSMTVKETSFFRQPEAYRFVRTYLGKRLDPDTRSDIQLWSVGCSTGEEAYSLAIVADEAIKAFSAKSRFGVIATDISLAALATAREAKYSARKFETMDSRARNMYFERVNEKQYAVKAAIKQRVCFTQGNIIDLEKSPIGEVDVIYCQNVMIYFQRNVRHQVLDQLAKRLKPGGILVAGLGETVDWRNETVRRLCDDTIEAYQRQ